MHPAKPLKLSREAARIFVRRALWLESARANDVASVLAHLGYVQLDPLNVCGRMQDLVVRNRVTQYTQGDLLRVVHGHGTEERVGRKGFEHYIPGLGILCAWPSEAYRFIRASIEWGHTQGFRHPLTEEQRVLGEFILRELADRGPLTSDDIEHEGRTITAWGARGRTVKFVLERLFRSGQVMISGRQGFRRVYDLAERVMPSCGVAALPDEHEVACWRALLSLRQRRLVVLKKREFELVEDQVWPIQIDGVVTLYCLREDLPLIETPEAEPLFAGVQLLAPLDPLIYDRKLTRWLWDFDFTWEVYTPAAKRKRGYYSLPILAGNALVGDVEPRAEWKSGRLVVVSRRVRRGIQVADALAGLADCLGLRTGGKKSHRRQTRVLAGGIKR